MASPVTPPSGEKKLSEFEEKMARRRALGNGDSPASVVSSTPSPTKSVSEIAKQFEAKKNSSPSTTPTSVNDFVRKLNSRQNSSPPFSTSPAKVVSPVAEAINKFNRSSSTPTTPPAASSISSPSTKSPLSASSELANKLNARRQAVEGTAASPIGSVSGDPKATTSLQAPSKTPTSSKKVMASTLPIFPVSSAAFDAPVTTVSPADKAAISGIGKPVVVAKPTMTTTTTAQAKSSPTTSTSTPLAKSPAASTPIGTVKSISPASSGGASELASKLAARKSAVDANSPQIVVSPPATKPTSSPNANKSPLATKQTSPLMKSDSPPTTTMSAVADKLAAGVSPAMQAHASFDSPRALEKLSPMSSFNQTSPSDIIVSPASTVAHERSLLLDESRIEETTNSGSACEEQVEESPEEGDTRIAEDEEEETQDYSEEAVYDQEEGYNEQDDQFTTDDQIVYEDDNGEEEPTETTEEPITFTRRVIVALSSFKSWFRRSRDDDQYVRERPRWQKPAAKPRVVRPRPAPRDLGIGKPYIPSYVPDEPLSTARTDSRMWTAVFVYILPLVVLTVAHILQATADERMFTQLPFLALLEPFPSTKTAPSEWAPTGIRVTPGIDRPTAPLMKATRASRAEDTRSGYVWTSAGPRFEPSWSTEHSTLIQNGGLAFDDWGNLFFCPTYTAQDSQVSLIALDAHSGERKWEWSIPVVAASFFSSAPAEPPIVRAGCGTPLVLNDPSAPLERRTPQIVYHATRTRAHALKSSDGSNIWTVPTGIAESPDFDDNRMWGLTYVANHDALIGVTNDGWIFVLDRATGAALTEVKKLPCIATTETELLQPRVPEGFEYFRTAFPAIEEKERTPPQLRCVLSSFAATSTDSSRLFITATSKERSDRASLYLVDIVEGEADSAFPFRVRLAQSVQIGNAPEHVGAPLVTADGLFVLVGDSSIGGVRGFHTANLTQVFAIEGLEGAYAPGQAPALSLAQDEQYGAVYVKTSSAVVKLSLEGRESDGSCCFWEEHPPVILWTQTFETVSPSPGLAMRPATAVSIVGNGIAVGVHVATTNYPYASLSGLPLTSGIAFIDRESGAVRSYVVQTGETLHDISVGMDGSVFGVVDPLLRAKSLEVFATYSVSLSPPLTGGIVKFKPLNFLELARDASCAALKRLENSLQYSGGWLSSPPPGGEEAGKEDARHVAALGWQSKVAFQLFILSIKSKNATSFGTIQQHIDLLGESVNGGTPLPVALTASTAFSIMRTVKPYVEVVCQELSAL